jgi:CspA family cold shock protein
MAIRDTRLDQFSSEAERPAGQLYEVLCEDNSGTYLLPFPCRWSDDAWWNGITSHRVEVMVVGWRIPLSDITHEQYVESEADKQGLSTMATGTVKFFNADKGYGFITPEGGGPDVFLHISALEAAGLLSVAEGDRISFDAVMDQRKGKTNAQNIKRL